MQQNNSPQPRYEVRESANDNWPPAPWQSSHHWSVWEVARDVRVSPKFADPAKAARVASEMEANRNPYRVVSVVR